MSVAAELPEPSPEPITVAEFLAWPGDGTGRIWELVNGRLRAQDAASAAHGTIQQRIGTLITNHLDATRPGYRVVANPGIRPRLLANWNHRIPELGVACTQNRADEQALTDPILLVEVLSPSNAKDTWDNVPLYASVPTVMEILVVDSTKLEAQLLRRGEDGAWPQEPAVYGPGDTITLASIGLEVLLAAAYRGTHLAEAN
jgi:Uma2 family endonuclease